MHIRSVLKRAQIGDVRVSSVDDFQGEENKVETISLSRLVVGLGPYPCPRVIIDA